MGLITEVWTDSDFPFYFSINERPLLLTSEVDHSDVIKYTDMWDVVRKRRKEKEK